MRSRPWCYCVFWCYCYPLVSCTAQHLEGGCFAMVSYVRVAKDVLVIYIPPQGRLYIYGNGRYMSCQTEQYVEVEMKRETDGSVVLHPHLQEAKCSPLVARFLAMWIMGASLDYLQGEVTNMGGRSACSEQDS